MREPILTLGKYEILDAIGSGGMATVYRARVSGPMGFEKPVAVKVLQEEAALDEEIVRMFVDEARIGARLSHPNIANVLDFGEAEGRYWLAMEYVEGTSLSALLKHLGKGRKPKPLDARAAVHVAVSILHALGYAHAATGTDRRPLGVVHRDVSPHNVLVDRSGAVRLCDFGIATGAWRAGRTRTGVVKGKAAYMSPEQAGGARVDSRSDLYSAGLTLLAMLVGGTPFSGKDTAEVRQHAQKGVDPDRLSGLEAPEGVKAALRKALAVRPEDRFATAEAFAQALADAVPDPSGEGRAILAKTVEDLPEPSAKSRLADRRPAKPKPAPAPAGTPAVRNTSISGLRIVLIAAAGVVVVALILALLGIGLPDL
jgi:serine/threonine-protein kinase